MLSFNDCSAKMELLARGLAEDSAKLVVVAKVTPVASNAPKTIPPTTFTTVFLIPPLVTWFVTLDVSLFKVIFPSSVELKDCLLDCLLVWVLPVDVFITCSLTLIYCANSLGLEGRGSHRQSGGGFCKRPKNPEFGLE